MSRAAVVGLCLSLVGCSQPFSFTTDGGTPDAGEPDAGRADAGEGDAGSPDGGCALLGQCQCTGEGQCPAAQPHCGADGRCVECRTTTDCGLNGQCDVLSRRCATLCTSAADCDAGVSCGDDLPRRCGLCEEDIQCTLTGARRCAQAPGVCVQCINDSDCGGATPHCDRTVGRCAVCVSDSQCGPTEYCALATRSCVARP